MQILEAFKALQALDEDIFDISAEGVKELSDFMDSDDLEDEVQVIDPEAEFEDDLQDSYVGKVILDCCVCHSKLYKDKEDIILDETGELANVGEDCPYCFTSDGFKVIGEVVAFEEKTTDEDKDSEEVKEKTEETETVEESLNEGIFGIKTKKEKAAEAKARAEREAKRKADEEAEEERELARQRSAADSWARHDANKRQAQQDYNRNRYNSIKGDKPSNTGYRGVNYSGGDYYSENLDEGIFGKKGKKEVYTISFKEDDGTWTPIHEFDNKADAIKFKDEYSKKNPEGKYMVHTGKKFESLEESIEDLSMTANDTHVEIGEDENGKVTVTMEPVTADGGEMISPVSDETAAEITDKSVEDENADVSEEEVDIEVDELDDEAMSELGESYLKKVYENVKSYKVIGVKSKGNSLIIEGNITFNNNSIKNSKFIFEALSTNGDGKVTFRGRNEITGDKNSFTLRGIMSENMLKPTALSYRYRALNEGKHQNIVGKIRL